MPHLLGFEMINDDSTVLQQRAIGELDHRDDPAPDLRQYFCHKARITRGPLFKRDTLLFQVGAHLGGVKRGRHAVENR